MSESEEVIPFIIFSPLSVSPVGEMQVTPLAGKLLTFNYLYYLYLPYGGG